MLFALLLFSIGLWEHHAQKNMPAAWLIATGIVVFCYGAYKAWKDEADQVVLLRAQLSHETPTLILSIGGGINRYDADHGVHVFILGVALGNAGAATSIGGWFATYEIGDSVEPMQSFHIMDGLVMRLGDDTKVFKQEEMMGSILAGKLIERRQNIFGRVLFTVPGDRTAQANALSYRIRLACTDFEGKRTEQVFSPSALSTTSHLYFAHETPPTPNQRQTLLNDL